MQELPKNFPGTFKNLPTSRASQIARTLRRASPAPFHRCLACPMQRSERPVRLWERSDLRDSSNIEVEGLGVSDAWSNARVRKAWEAVGGHRSSERAALNFHVFSNSILKDVRMFELSRRSWTATLGAPQPPPRPFGPLRGPWEANWEGLGKALQESIPQPRRLSQNLRLKGLTPERAALQQVREAARAVRLERDLPDH